MTATPHPDQSSPSLACAVLTVSDTRTPATDKSGQLIQARLLSAGHRVAAYEISPDEPVQVRALVSGWIQQRQGEVILISGGTGIAPRDTTYEAIAALLIKPLPGFGELFRVLSYGEIGSRAMASRAIAGVCENNSLLFSMPGSSKAVALAMDRLIVPELVHLATQLQGKS